LVAFLLELGADDGRINDGTRIHLNAARFKVLMHPLKYLPSEIVFLQQVTELTHRGLIRHRFAAKVDADKLPHRH
jgi:hypothetical protein